MQLQNENISGLIHSSGNSEEQLKTVITHKVKVLHKKSKTRLLLFHVSQIQWVFNQR